MTPNRLRAWAEEHLMYEVDTLVYVTIELGQNVAVRSARENALLESFVVHARCLNDFLWHDRNKKNPRDAFAADFCTPGDWEEVRRDLTQTALEDVRKRNRFGREVVHLTYDRVFGDGDAKRWRCGEVVAEIAYALAEFAEAAVAGSLGETTHGSLSELPKTLGLEKKSGPLGPRARRIAVATGLTHGQIRKVSGGTVHFPGIQAGGERA